MLWGGRFEEKPDKKALEFSSSLKEDILLIKEEILCGKAYAEMLYRINVISSIELNSITDALSLIETEYYNNQWTCARTGSHGPPLRRPARRGRGCPGARWR